MSSAAKVVQKNVPLIVANYTQKKKPTKKNMTFIADFRQANDVQKHEENEFLANFCLQIGQERHTNLFFFKATHYLVFFPQCSLLLLLFVEIVISLGLRHKLKSLFF